MPRAALRAIVLPFLTGCAAVPADRQPAVPPALLPLSRLFANPQATWGYRVSPAGRRLGWISSHQGRTTIFFREIDTDRRGVIDTHSRRSVQGYVVFSDEGHRRDYGNWRNAIRHYTEGESFLADCLGGRRPGSS